jgi:hypothetical protein
MKGTINFTLNFSNHLFINLCCLFLQFLYNTFSNLTGNNNLSHNSKKQKNKEATNINKIIKCTSKIIIFQISSNKKNEKIRGCLLDID